MKPAMLDQFRKLLQSRDTRALRARRALLGGAVRVVKQFSAIERAEGTLEQTWQLTKIYKWPVFPKDWTAAKLLEWAAETYRYASFLEYEKQRFSFNDMNRRANRVARRLQQAGIGRGVGVAIMIGNHPRFLDTFFAVQKLGACAVPVNVGLVGDGLEYVLNHSEARAVIMDHETAPKVEAVRGKLERVEKFYVSTAEAPHDFRLPHGMQDFGVLERGTVDDGDNLGVYPDPADPSLLSYTSGTTGLPKAVVTFYGNQRMKGLGVISHLQYDRTDKLYTCLPLFHANAMMLTIVPALWVGIPVILSKRFSASRFWKEVADSGATQFNTVGGMIPILLKTPPTPYDRAHKVKRIMSAACPKDAWVPFEQRFGVDIWEGYGAVDGAGVTITNMGNAPVGSIGKPPATMKYRLVDAHGNDAPVGQPGELWVYVGELEATKVRYFKNEQASSEKVKDGWLRTGDSMQADQNGFLYFVGRNTDSMRRRGENVSAFEVERQVDAYPDVLESAAFGVPSPLGEQDIMVCVVPVEGRTIDPKGLLAHLQQRLPKYAVPSYLEIASEFPKTGTHRTQKNELKARGITEKTIHLEKLDN